MLFASLTATPRDNIFLFSLCFPVVHFMAFDESPKNMQHYLSKTRLDRGNECPRREN